MSEQVRQNIVKFTCSMHPISKSESNIVSSKKRVGLTIKCDICLFEYFVRQRVQFAKCGHSFCDSCLRHYVDYKISHFEQIICPSGDCTERIDVNTPFFMSLSLELREKYKKVQAFAMVIKNPQLRMCPNQKCNDGIINVSTGKSPVCNKCWTVYCEKCFYPQHSGTCDQTELNFFLSNFKFRQCAQCKNVIQKSEGCNYITCRCGYQFCYLCCSQWKNNNHICGELDLQQIIQKILAQPQQVYQRYVDPEEPQQRPLIINLLIIIFKIVIVFPFALIFVILFLSSLFILGLILFVGFIIKGLFYDAYKIVKDAQYPWKVILIIIFPLTMIWGAGKSLYQALSLVSLTNSMKQLTNCIFGIFQSLARQQFRQNFWQDWRVY